MDIRDQLPDLFDIAWNAQVEPDEGDGYDPIGSQFCDGVLVKLGHIPLEHARVSAIKLKSDMQVQMESLIISNVKHFSNAGGSAIWISFSPETACELPRLRADIDRLEKAAREHAKQTWGYKLEDLEAIKVAKIDIAQDFSGSFLPYE